MVCYQAHEGLGATSCWPESMCFVMGKAISLAYRRTEMGPEGPDLAPVRSKSPCRLPYEDWVEGSLAFGSHSKGLGSGLDPDSAWKRP